MQLLGPNTQRFWVVGLGTCASRNNPGGAARRHLMPTFEERLTLLIQTDCHLLWRFHSPGPWLVPIALPQMAFPASDDLPLPPEPTYIPQETSCSCLVLHLKCARVFVFCLFVCLPPLQTLKRRPRCHVWFMSALFTFSTILAQSRGPVNIWVQWNEMILCSVSQEMKARGPWHSLRNPSEIKKWKSPVLWSSITEEGTGRRGKK